VSPLQIIGRWVVAVVGMDMDVDMDVGGTLIYVKGNDSFFSFSAGSWTESSKWDCARLTY
jgi:hypothetical protein